MTSHKVTLILSDVEADLIETSAREQNVSVAEFVRRSALTMCVTLRPELADGVAEVGGA